MRNSLRKSGIDIIGDVPWGTYICQFYQTKEDLTDILVPYFKAGLENNEFCLWVTSQLLGVEEAKEALGKSVPDIDVYLEKGQIEIIPHTQWDVKEGVFDYERVLKSWVEKRTYALYNGYNGMRLSGNTSWLDKENWDRSIKSEEQTDNVFGNYQMIAICTYYLDRHNATEIINLSVNHQFTLIKSEGIWEHIESSKRKIAVETAVKAAKDWEHAFDAVPDLIAIIDTEYRIVRANRAMSSKLGATPEECIGSTCYSVVHRTTKPPSFCPHRQLLKDGLEHTSEVCEDCLGGYFIVSVSPLYDSEGKLTGSIHVARDINERRQMEEALRKSEEKYRNLIETANEGIFSMNSEFMITYANKRTAEMMGYAQREIIGRPVMDFIHEESKPIAEGSLENRSRGINERYELKLMRKDGIPFWAFISAKPLFNKDGDFTGSLSMLTDITKRKQAEMALQESEIRFRTLAENSPDIITRFDKQHRHIYANPAAVESYYISLDEIIGKTQGELGRDTKKVKSWEAHLENTFVTGKIETMEYCISLHGKKYCFNTKIIPEFFGGKVISVLAISRDITDIKEAEAKLKGTLDNLEELVEERTIQLEKAYKSLKESEVSLAEAQKMAHIGNWEWDILTNKAYWSEEIYRIFGLNLQELAPTYNEYLNYVHPDDRDYVDDAIKEAVKGKSFSIDHRILLYSGEERTVHKQSQVIFDDNQIPIRIKGIVQDITERRKAEEKICESEEKYRNIVETANEGILIIDNEAIITYGNKKLAHMLGYTLAESVGRPIWDFLSEESKSIVKLNLNKRWLGIDDNYELKLIRKDGSHLWTCINAKPLFDKDGKLTGSMSMLTDITKRKEAEEALANIEIARKKEIHHRIKNNLQVISSLLDLQAEKFNKRECIKYSEVLEAFKESQDRVISMALIHEELYKGGGLDKLNFSPYIEELAENLFHTYSFGNTDISLKLDLEENVCFDMDVAVPLGMIINELVSNSFKHAFFLRNEGEIQIKLHREENGEHINSINDDCMHTNFAVDSFRQRGRHS